MAGNDHLRVVAIDDRPDPGAGQFRLQGVGQRPGGAEEEARGPHLHRFLLLSGGPDPFDLGGQVRRGGADPLGALDLRPAVVGQQDQAAAGRVILQHGDDFRVEIVDVRQHDRLVIGRHRAVQHVFFHDRGEGDVDHLGGEVDRQQPAAGEPAAHVIVFHPGLDLGIEALRERVEQGHLAAARPHRAEDGAQPQPQLVRLHDARRRGGGVGGVHHGVGRLRQPLQVVHEAQVLFQPVQLVARGVAPVRQVPVRLVQLPHAAELLVVGGIEVAARPVVVAAVPADDRQGANDVEVVAVGVAVPGVLALGGGNQLRIDLVDGEAGVFPGRLQEALFPAAPELPPGRRRGIARFHGRIGNAVGAEGAAERAELGRHGVRRAVFPGEPRLVVEVHAQRVGLGAVHEGLLRCSGRGPLEHVGVGPVALLAEVHLVPPAHGAALHVIGPAADRGLRVGRVGLQAVVAQQQVEAHAVFAEDRHLRALDAAAPVDRLERAAAKVAEDVDLGRGRGPVDRGGNLVVPRTQQPAVQVQMLGGRRSLGPDRHRPDGKHQRDPTAVAGGQREVQVRCRQGLHVAADDAEVDLFVGLIGRASQGQRELQRCGRKGPGRQDESSQRDACQQKNSLSRHGILPSIA